MGCHPQRMTVFPARGPPQSRHAGAQGRWADLKEVTWCFTAQCYGVTVFYSYIRAILKEVNNAVILKEVNGVAAEKPVTKQARQLSEA